MLAKRIRDLRQELGMSRHQLALVLGVTAQTIYWWETGRSIPSKANMKALQRESLSTRDPLSDAEVARLLAHG